MSNTLVPFVAGAIAAAAATHYARTQIANDTSYARLRLEQAKQWLETSKVHAAELPELVRSAEPALLERLTAARANMNENVLPTARGNWNDGVKKAVDALLSIDIDLANMRVSTSSSSRS